MSIKLVSWNVNGIRAVSKKDEFWDWFDNTDADIINFQEVRATKKDIPKKLADVEDYDSYFNEAEKKGYMSFGFSTGSDGFTSPMYFLNEPNSYFSNRSATLLSYA